MHSAGPAYGTGGYLDGVKDKMSTKIEPSKDAYREQTHPAVIAHAETNRPALYRQSGLHPAHRGLVEGGVATACSAMSIGMR